MSLIAGGLAVCACLLCGSMYSLDVKKIFGMRVAHLRKAKGWSQEKLALESGISRSYIGDVERGERNISLVNICRIASTMGINLSHLMDFPIETEDDVLPSV